MAAAGGKKEASCALFDCVCCWRRDCSPRTPRVAPGRDYVCMPAGADDRPAWSLLVGSLSQSATLSESVLSLHEFRVARSGRILGRSDDALELRHSVVIASADAAPAPDGRSICLFSEYLELERESRRLLATHRAQRLRLSPRAAAVSELPRLPLEPTMRYRPVSAAGRVWAPQVCLERDGSSIAMHRLDEDAGRWEQVGDAFELPQEMKMAAARDGPLLQGFAVLHDDDTILVSLRPAHGLFVAFNCSSATWTEVALRKPTSYINTIVGRGIHIKEDADDGTVYYLRSNVDIFAYKLCYDQDQDQPNLKLEPPAKIDSVCPFYKEGDGSLTHLGGRLMCSVWINTEFGSCSCDHLHVLITTFRLRPQQRGGIEVLHSTCRRLYLSSLPGPSTRHEFCFLQEYEDNQDAIPPPPTPDDTTRSVDKMPDCCRNFVNERPSRFYRFPEPAVRIDGELYLFYEEFPGDWFVYVAKIENGRCHDQVLAQKYSLITSDRSYCEYPPWHLVLGASNCSPNIHAVSRGQHGAHVYRLTEGVPLRVAPTTTTEPSSDPFSMVFQVGHQIVAVTDTLHVFCRDQSKSKPSWVPCSHRADKSLLLYKKGRHSRHGLVVQEEKADLSGYAVLGDDSFVVSDAKTRSFLLYDLRSEMWSLMGFASPLIGRSVFVDGFIYTCTTDGIHAYDVRDLGDSIFLQFSWRLPWGNNWVDERMCLDCMHASPHAVVLCVVQGEYGSRHRGSSASDVHITTVRVKIRTTLRGKREPEGIEHLDIGTCFIEHSRTFWRTRSCFAVGT